MISSLWEKMKDPEYRRAFVASLINVGLPFQIRALLKSRQGWTQATLSERTGMMQPRVSGLMTPGRTRPNIETLRRVAEAFDCGLMVRFVPFSELARWSEGFDPESFSVPCFENDAGFIDRKGPSSATTRQAETAAATGTDAATATHPRDLAKVITISPPRTEVLYQAPRSGEVTQVHGDLV